MRFRGYTPAHIEAMFQLDALCFTEPFQFDRLTMRQFAEEPGAIVILVEDDDCAQLIGFIILHLEGEPDGASAYVVTIDVSPGHRCKGIGGAMLDRAEAVARSAGAMQITLHVAADNLAAIAFYERQDYERAGIAKLFYREAGQDAILFAKPL
jgi:ribosomal-protein-alanine N-acetyltransferase